MLAYLQILTLVYTSTHTQSKTFIHAFRHRHTHVHTDTHIQTQTHTCTHRHTHVHTDTHMHTQTHTCIHYGPANYANIIVSILYSSKLSRQKTFMIFVTLNGIMKIFSQIFSHTRQERRNIHNFMKVFIMKYLFWNRIQEITKFFAAKVWSYTIIGH